MGISRVGSLSPKRRGRFCSFHVDAGEKCRNATRELLTGVSGGHFVWTWTTLLAKAGSNLALNDSFVPVVKDKNRDTSEKL